VLETVYTVYTENEVTYISDQIGLHKMANNSDDNVAVPLHLYTPPHAANREFHLYDEKSGKTHVKQAGFYSERGAKLGPAGPGNFKIGK
jgi:cysteine dioxygenase